MIQINCFLSRARYRDFRREQHHERVLIVLAIPADRESFVPIQSQACGDPVITQLVGGSPIEVPDRYRAASPSRLLPIGVRQIVITGAHDRIVPAALGRTYEETAHAHGDDVTALVVPDAAHFEVIAPGSKAWPVVRDAVLSILGLTGAPRAI